MPKAGEVVELLMLTHGEPPSGRAAPLTAEVGLSSASAHRKLKPRAGLVLMGDMILSFRRTISVWAAISVWSGRGFT
jgi:hypothetical protein